MSRQTDVRRGRERGIQLIGVLQLIVNHDVLRIFRAEVSEKGILFRRCCPGRVFVSHNNLTGL